MNNADHPIWPLLRSIVLIVACLVTFQFCYYNKLSTSDIIPIVTIVLSILGVDITKYVINLRSSQK